MCTVLYLFFEKNHLVKLLHLLLHKPNMVAIGGLHQIIEGWYALTAKSVLIFTTVKPHLVATSL